MTQAQTSALKTGDFLKLVSNPLLQVLPRRCWLLQEQDNQTKALQEKNQALRLDVAQKQQEVR